MRVTAFEKLEVSPIKPTIEENSRRNSIEESSKNETAPIDSHSHIKTLKIRDGDPNPFDPDLSKTIKPLPALMSAESRIEQSDEELN